MARNLSLASALQQTGIIDPDQALKLQQSDTPWWLQVILGIAAWIASILILIAFIGPIVALAENDSVCFVIGALLLGAACWLAMQRQDFLQHMSTAVALAGQGLFVYALYSAFNSDDELARYGCALISAVLLFSPLTQLHQRVSLSIGLVCLISLLNSSLWLALGSNLLALGCLVLWCSRPKWATLAMASRIKSVLEVATLATLWLALHGQGMFYVDDYYWPADNLYMASTLYSALGAILLLSTVFWLSRFASVPSRLLLLSVTAALCVLLYPASGLLISAAFMLACFYACSIRWYALSLLSVLVALSQFYYSMQLTLFYKSGLLALSGGVLLVGLALLQRYQKRLL